MRYCKYFIAKFNEAAVLHLDFSDICMSQLHVVGCDESDHHRPLKALMAVARCECNTAAHTHFKLCVDVWRPYDEQCLADSWGVAALSLNPCQFTGSSPRGQISPELTEPQTWYIFMHRGGRSSLPYTSKQTSSSPLCLFVLLAVCSLLYKLWRAAPTNNALVINHCWFDVKSFGNGGWHWLQ